MMRRLLAIASAAALALASIGATAAPVAAVQTCTQLVYVYDGLNATGLSRALCAEDYPLVRNPPTGASFDGAIYFQGTTTPLDNRISSVRFDPGIIPGYRIRLYTGYYFAGSTYIVSLAPGQTVNIGASMNNQASSFAGCAASCNDEP